MTPVGDIEIEVVLSVVVRARAKDLVPFFSALSSGQQFIVIVIEDSRCYEDQHIEPVQPK
jgi:hypothetical protein